MMRPSRSEAECAVKTLLAWIGEDPGREGLLETPRRFVDAFAEFYAGYNIDTHSLLSKTFSDAELYDDIVLVKDIRLESHCEHHMAPMLGFAHVAYIPNGNVVGLSKIARVVEAFAKRLQTQERMTRQIADAINESLNPKGVAVIIKAKHHCMTMRGVHKPLSWTVTNARLGLFEETIWQKQLYSMLNI